MRADLADAIREMAQMHHTGTAPGRPARPFVPEFMTGTISAVASGSCTVDFPDTGGGSYSIAGIPYLLTGRTLTAGDVVLVLQLQHQRIVLAAISH